MNPSENKLNPFVISQARNLVRDRPLYEDALNRLARYISNNRIRTVFIEGDSAIPTWKGLMGAWKTIYPKKFPPKKIHIPSAILDTTDPHRLSRWKNHLAGHTRSLNPYAPCLVLTDFISSGKSLETATQLIRQMGMQNIKTAALGYLHSSPAAKTLDFAGGDSLVAPFLRYRSRLWSGKTIPLSAKLEYLGPQQSSNPLSIAKRRKLMHQMERIMAKIGQGAEARKRARSAALKRK